jgi:hypothetical protein
MEYADVIVTTLIRAAKSLSHAVTFSEPLEVAYYDLARAIKDQVQSPVEILDEYEPTSLIAVYEQRPNVWRSLLRTALVESPIDQTHLLGLAHVVMSRLPGTGTTEEPDSPPPDPRKEPTPSKSR